MDEFTKKKLDILSESYDFQLAWSEHCLENQLYDLKREYGYTAFMKCYEEFLEDYLILNK